MGVSLYEVATNRERGWGSLDMREDDGLTAEQKTRMENNRLLALERLKQRHQRLEQQGKTFAPTSVPLPAPVVAQVNIRLEARKKADVPRERVQVETQMETFVNFSCSPHTTLNTLYRSIPGAVYLVENNYWRFPISQYQNFRTMFLSPY